MVLDSSANGEFPAKRMPESTNMVLAWRASDVNMLNLTKRFEAKKKSSASSLILLLTPNKPVLTGKGVLEALKLSSPVALSRA